MTNIGCRSDTDMSVDPNEPVYCYCQGVSYGEMVACDNTEVKKKKKSFLYKSLTNCLFFYKV